MAVTRLMPLHVGKGKTISAALGGTMDYVENPDKTDNQQWVTSYRCDPYLAEQEFMFTKAQYATQTGRNQGARDVIAYHLRQSFKPGEITPELANQLGYELVLEFTKGQHAFVVCTHVDKAHIHNHIIFHSTTLDCQKKFRNFKDSALEIRNISDRLSKEHSLSIVERPKGKPCHYGMSMDVKPPTQRQDLANAIENVLCCDVSSMEQFIKLMVQRGFEMKGGKHLAFRRPGRKRFIRVDSIHERFFCVEDLARFGGSTVGTFVAITVNPPEEPLGTLIDIEAKMVEGRGAAYEQWATEYNLKTMAKTLCFLHDNDLLCTGDLDFQAETLTEEAQSIKDEIGIVEHKMKETKTMRGFVIDFLKTQDVFEEYRKSGYSRDFKEAHKDALELRATAKAYFKEKDVEKLQTPQELKTEYEVFLTQKNKLYAKYREANARLKPVANARRSVYEMLSRPLPPRKTITRQNSYER